MGNVDNLVGQRIRARRLALGLTQADLGNKIGVRFQQVQKYETGANRVSASRLWAIANALEVSIVYFFEGVGSFDTVDRGPRQTDLLGDRETVEMLAVYSDLPAPQKRAVLNFVKSLSPAARSVSLETS